MKLVNQKLTKHMEDPIVSINIPRYNPNKQITTENITQTDTDKINKWLSKSIGGNITYRHIVDDINDIVRIFMAEYNITLPNEFNDDLILFLFNNSFQ